MGARTIAQAEDNLGALTESLSDEQRARLDAVSALEPYSPRASSIDRWFSSSPSAAPKLRDAFERAGTQVVATDYARERNCFDSEVTAMQRNSSDNFAIGRTDENDLRADDFSLPQRVRDLIHIGNIGIAKEDNAAMAAFFHPQFRFHGPGAELNREQLWEYFAACRAAFDDFTVTRQAVVADGGDYLATRTRFAGVFARTFTGLPEGPREPNGKRFEYRVINIFRYAPNGQLLEEWVQYDTQAFVAQLQ